MTFLIKLSGGHFIPPMWASWLALVMLALAIVLISWGAVALILEKHLSTFWHYATEAEYTVSVLGLVFIGIVLNGVSHAADHLPFGEALTIGIVTLVGMVGVFVLYRSGMLDKMTKALPDPVLGLFAVGVAPLLGSGMGEPAAMIVGCALLADIVGSLRNSLRYILVGFLFVNVSIGGLLTTFAAPPVVAVADAWDLTNVFMRSNFAFPVLVAMAVNGGIAALIITTSAENTGIGKFELKLADVIKIPVLTGLFVLGVVSLTEWASPLLKFVYADGLVVAKLATFTMFFDNAGLAALGGALVPEPDHIFIYYALAALTGFGGMTVIANAPNPIGFMLLGHAFDRGVMSPLKQTVGAILPTAITWAIFMAFTP